MTCVLRLATARSDQQHSSFNNGFMLSFLKGVFFHGRLHGPSDWLRSHDDPHRGANLHIFSVEEPLTPTNNPEKEVVK